MPKTTEEPRTAAGMKGLGAGQTAKSAFDPAKVKGPKGPQGKHLVNAPKRLLVPGKGRAR
jgi:hypothetical protein